MWGNFYIPGIIWHITGNLQGKLQIYIAELGNGHILIRTHIVLPDLIIVTCCFQRIQIQLLHKFIPVQNQQGKSPELFVSIGIFCVHRIKKQRAGTSLYQFKRSGNGILAALFGQTGFLFSLWMGKHIKANGFFVFLQGINLGHLPILRQFKGFHYMSIVL